MAPYYGSKEEEWLVWLSSMHGMVSMHWGMRTDEPANPGECWLDRGCSGASLQQAIVYEEASKQGRGRVVEGAW